MDAPKKTPLGAVSPDTLDPEGEILPDSTPILALDDDFFSDATLRENQPDDPERNAVSPMSETPSAAVDAADLRPEITPASEPLFDDPRALLEPFGPALADVPPPVVQPDAERGAPPIRSVQEQVRAETPAAATEPPASLPAPPEARIATATRELHFSPFVLECSAGRFMLSPGHVQPLTEDETPAFWHTLITDFHTAPGPGVITVDTAPKYAHVLAQRTLQRNGELTDDLELRVLAKRRAATQTLLAYQLAPKQPLARLATLAERSPNGFLLHDSATLLQGLLRSWAKGQTVALLLHLPRALVLMSGRNGRILWCRRFALASDDGPNFRSSVDAALHDMRQAAREVGFDVERTVWIEGWSRHATMPPTQTPPLDVFPVRAMRGDGAVWFTALPDLLARVDSGAAFTPAADRTLARLQPWEKWLWTVTVAASLFLGGAGWWLDGEAARIEARRTALQTHKAGLQTTLDELTRANVFPDQDRDTLAKATETARMLHRAQSAPPAALLWNTVARLRPPSCRVQALEITHDAERVRLRLEGSIELGLTQAQSVYTNFLEALGRADLHVAQQEFRLDLDTNFFSLLLEKGAEE